MGSHAPMRAGAPESRNPRPAYSELYRHWFISNLTCPASPDVTFAAVIHCVRAAKSDREWIFKRPAQRLLMLCILVFVRRDSSASLGQRTNGRSVQSFFAPDNPVSVVSGNRSSKRQGGNANRAGANWVRPCSPSPGHGFEIVDGPATFTRGSLEQSIKATGRP